MTVQELVDFLKTLPPDLPIVYHYLSDVAVLEAETIKVQPGDKPLGWGVIVHHHNMPGEFRVYCGEKYRGKEPQVANVVILN